jgi:N-ethylmaleimide reductase
VGEIPEVIQEFRHAATAARSSGAEDIEIHGASGYLILQFPSDNANLRADRMAGLLKEEFFAKS